MNSFMDINFLRSASTVLSFLFFLGIIFWAYKPSNKKEFDEAAQLPFAEEIK